MNKQKHVFVQGSGSPKGDAARTIKKLGILLSEADCQCHVGSQGKIPDILAASGVNCLRYDFGGGKETSSLPGTTFYLPIARRVTDEPELKASDKEISWGLRLVDWVSRCDSFALFKGDAGTLAHLFPILAFAIKRWAKKGNPRRIALIGWSRSEIAAIEMLLGFTDGDFPDWCVPFTYGQINEAAEFLTK